MKKNEKTVRKIKKSRVAVAIIAFALLTADTTIISNVKAKTLNTLNAVNEILENSKVIEEQFGNGMRFRLYEDGALVIHGYDNIPDYESAEQTPWFEYNEQIESISFEGNINKIGAYAFSKLPNLKSVAMSNTILTINNGAFRNCPSLETISMPDNLTSDTSEIYTGVEIIGNNVFENCCSLKEIRLPSSLREIGEYAFAGCNGLTEIKIPENVTWINDYAFFECKNLFEVFKYTNVNDNGIYYSDEAFSGCPAIISYQLKEITES